jgi:beta-phosphoglucomutase family hydrolase
MSKLEAVIFDMDGVIIDSEPIYFKIERDLFDELGLDVSQKEHESFVGMTMEGLWEKMTDEYQLEETIEDLTKLHKDSVFKYMSEAKELPIVEYIKELIEELRNRKIKLAVASSSPKKLIEIILTKFNLQDSFDLIISGEEVEKGKPAPDIFTEAAYRLDINPNDCVVIEDSSNGVKAAKAAMMKCIGFQNINSGDQDLSLADITVDSIGKIDVKLLKGLF